MEQEYTISTGMKIFYGVLAAGMFVFAVFLFNMPTQHSQAVFLIPLIIMGGGVLIVVNILRRKVVVYDDRITVAGLFSQKELDFKEVKGYRIDGKRFVIEPVSPELPRLNISNYDDFKDSSQLVDFVKEKFTDQNKADLAMAHKTTMEDIDLGATEIERRVYLSKIKYAYIVYNIVGFVAGFAMIFIKANWGLIVLLLYPLLGIVLMGFSKGLIKFVSNTKRSVYGFTMVGIAIPSFILLIRSCFNYTLLYFAHLWLPAFGVSALLLFVIYKLGINRQVASIITQTVIMAVFSLLYGFGSIRNINCAFDNIEPEQLVSKVANKWVEHGKSTTWTLQLTSWDDNPSSKDIEVSRSTYAQYAIGSDIKVYLKPGLLHIPWFYVEN